ncbi:hypothetical protein LINPERPRIM_LOCUS2316 [Linum perenne]
MVSNGGSSNSTGASKMPHGMRCRHHCEAVMNVAGTPKNRGRVFYRCPFWRDGRADCGFFRWVDQMPKEKERMVVRDTTMEDSNDVAGYLQRNDDPRDTAGGPHIVYIENNVYEIDKRWEESDTGDRLTNLFVVKMHQRIAYEDEKSSEVVKEFICLQKEMQELCTGEMKKTKSGFLGKRKMGKRSIAAGDSEENQKKTTSKRREHPIKVSNTKNPFVFYLNLTKVLTEVTFLSSKNVERVHSFTESFKQHSAESSALVRLNIRGELEAGTTTAFRNRYYNMDKTVPVPCINKTRDLQERNTNLRNIGSIG